MDSETPQIIDVQNLTKKFRRVTAVKDLTFSVNAGETVALLGANGSGKSTTFRLLLNIYRPTAGTANILGEDSRKLDGASFHRIGFVSESQKLPEWMTVGRFINYCSKLYPNWDRAFEDDLVKRFQLPAKQKLKNLSRGQKMKTAVAAVLPSRPDLLFLDEPFSGLDVETRAQLAELLRDATNESQMTTLITTHDVEEVERFASRILLLDQGEKQIDESLPSFLNRHPEKKSLRDILASRSVNL